ncbi:hypothetical protein [Arcobacter cloacae]|uniref:Uncharacterized protein n=1 Tax=Arcobacter cloacae TaxID=1054034 RepID=A0A6M8NTE7_9BACT|nr:hypothetical protein [Arcobacter cloacae]QKF91194.1 putative membrane protein [Arcobacter cloacae]RXI40431.1 hypothetical protein CP963_08550 [Arcobacter cloacae]
MIKKIYNDLSTPEEKGKTIGLFRTITAIFGGLVVAYLGMTLLAFVIPLEIKEAAIFSIMFNTFVWACTATWIALSFTKLEALLKFIVPTTIFSIALYFLY